MTFSPWRGPVLCTGDTSHTRWGWENGVEPGTYTADQAQNADSLERRFPLGIDQHRVNEG